MSLLVIISYLIPIYEHDFYRFFGYCFGIFSVS